VEVAIVADISVTKQKEENPMDEIKNNEPCCEEISTDIPCLCSSDECDCEKPVGRKTQKLIICLVVLLAVISIVAFKVVTTSGSSNNAAFDFGQIVLETTSSGDDLIQTNQNLGEYLESLNELNMVALDKDVVFVFIPGSENILVDYTTRASIADAKQTLENSNITVGLYTLPCDSPDYSIIAAQVELPIIYIARKGSGAVTIHCSNISENMLLQAYLACCDTSSGCCGGD